MRKLIIIMGVVSIFLCACSVKDRKTNQTDEETIKVGFVNSVNQADVWIINNIEENRKTSTWGTASIKDAEQEKDYSVTLEKNSDDTYLFRMIDVDGIYYESNAITLKEGYSLLIFRSDENDGEA